MPKIHKNILAELPSPETIDIPALAKAYADGDIDLICVLGPTASGKTKYAVRLAHQLAEACASLEERRQDLVFSAPSEKINPAARRASCEIISADSRQVYRRMDIGTGKDLEEYGDIPYHLIDIAEPGERYNVHRYCEDFAKAYADIRSRGAIPILCGGTGLYINAVTSGYDFEHTKPLSAPADHTAIASRSQKGPFLSTDQEKTGLGSQKGPFLLTDKEKTDFGSQKGPFLLTGQEKTDFGSQKGPFLLTDKEKTGLGSQKGPFLSTDQKEVELREQKGPILCPDGEKMGFGEQKGPILCPRTYFIGTLVSREERNRRIDARLRARLQEGMVEEIRGLLEGDPPVPAERLLEYGLEYRYVTMYIQGQLTEDELFTKLSTAIHQFAKRQMTWFRGMERSGAVIHWTEV